MYVSILFLGDLFYHNDDSTDVPQRHAAAAGESPCGFLLILLAMKVELFDDVR